MLSPHHATSASKSKKYEAHESWFPFVSSRSHANPVAQLISQPVPDITIILPIGDTFADTVHVASFILRNELVLSTIALRLAVST
jgi:hypothetical protein